MEGARGDARVVVDFAEVELLGHRVVAQQVVSAVVVVVVAEKIGLEGLLTGPVAGQNVAEQPPHVVGAVQPFEGEREVVLSREYLDVAEVFPASALADPLFGVPHHVLDALFAAVSRPLTEIWCFAGRWRRFGPSMRRWRASSFRWPARPSASRFGAGSGAGPR